MEVEEWHMLSGVLAVQCQEQRASAELLQVASAVRALASQFSLKSAGH